MFLDHNYTYIVKVYETGQMRMCRHKDTYAYFICENFPLKFDVFLLCTDPILQTCYLLLYVNKRRKNYDLKPTAVSDLLA